MADQEPQTENRESRSEDRAVLRRIRQSGVRFVALRRRSWRGGSLLGVLLALYLAMLAGVLPTLPGQAAPDQQPLVVRIRDAGPLAAQELTARGIDLLEMREGNDLFALVTATQQAELIAAGWKVQAEVAQTVALRNVSPALFLDGYRTVEETEQFLRDVATNYPNLARLVDFGDSWERQQPGGRAGYDLLALRLTNQATPGPKPVFFLLAAIHAREITTSELATRFITALVSGYGSDATATWLLDEHEIVVVPIANPDGRKLAEQGFLQRKNTNNSGSVICANPPNISNQYGVDLNRNSSFRWNEAGTSFEPCSAIYAGTAAASEPETQAVQALISELFPNRPRPATGTPAPDDTTGVMISLHSYANLVLWPWGYTNEPAPNGPALERLGQRMAAFNGYQAVQSINLYPTSGTTDEWAYAELGLAAYTFEVGPGSGPCSGFMPAYSCLDGGSGGNFWGRNFPALIYAARVARAPYTQPAGPEVSNVVMTSDTAVVTITATLDGRNQPVAGAEFAFNQSPAINSTVFALEPVDGVFDEAQEQAQLVLPRSNLPPSSPERPPLLLVRGRSAADVWGPVSANWLAAQYYLWVPLVQQRAGG